MLVDTHAHIHSSDYRLDPLETLKRARTAGIAKVLCVGTNADDSEQAIKFVANKNNCWASVGQHPHEASDGRAAIEKLEKLVTKPKVVAIGECGLDYYYQHSPKQIQQTILKDQIALALNYKLPLIFHVREAFEDFFKIIDEYKEIRGVVHSFTADTSTLNEVLSRGLFVGLNGIMTFTKEDTQLAAAKAVPLEKMLIETDSPFLTPSPFRGKINEPKNAEVIASFLAKLRGETAEDMAIVTTTNANNLFKLS